MDLCLFISEYGFSTASPGTLATNTIVLVAVTLFVAMNIGEVSECV